MKKDLLRTILSKPGDITGLFESGGPDVVRELWKISTDPGAKRDERKAAKKALYILRSGGVDVDGLRPAHERTEHAPEDERVESAFISAPDNAGSSSLVVSTVRSTGSITFYRFIIHGEHGVQRFTRTRGSGRSLQEITASPLHVPVPPRYGIYRLRSALDAPGGVSGLGSLPSVLTSGETDPEHPAWKLVESRLSLIATPGETKGLFALPEIGSMTVPDEYADGYRTRIEEAQKSRIILMGRSPEERVRDIVNGFVRFYFTPGRLRDMQTRLLDTALVCSFRGEEKHVRPLLAQADGLAGGELMKNPIIGFLIYKTFRIS